MVSKGARGERYVDVDGDRIEIIFTNRAIAESESTIGKTIIQMAQGFSSGNVGLNEVAILLQSGMEQGRRESKSGSRQVSIADAFRVMDAVGFPRTASLVFEAITDVISYNGTGENENF